MSRWDWFAALLWSGIAPFSLLYLNSVTRTHSVRLKELEPEREFLTACTIELDKQIIDAKGEDVDQRIADQKGCSECYVGMVRSEIIEVLQVHHPNGRDGPDPPGPSAGWPFLRIASCNSVAILPSNCACMCFYRE